MTNPDGQTSDPLRALTDDLTTLVRQELQRVQDELVEKARQAGRGGALLGGASALGALSAGMSTVFLVRFLDRFLPPATSALVATALFGTGATALAASGWKEIRRSVPTDVVSHVREDVRAAASRPAKEPPTAGTATQPGR